MKLIEGRPDLEIFPDKEFASALIIKEFYKRGSSGLPAPIANLLECSIFNSTSLITTIESFRFQGFYRHEFKKFEDAEEFKLTIEDLITKTHKRDVGIKIDNIDDIIFIFFLYEGFIWDLNGYKAELEYLDELAKVLLSLVKKPLNIDVESLTQEEEEILIINHDDVEARMVVKEIKTESENKYENILIPISNRFDMVLEDRDYRNNRILLPERLTKRFFKQIVGEIFEMHRKFDTSLYKSFKKGDYLNKTLDDISNANKRKRINRSIAPLIGTLIEYLDKKHSSSPIAKVEKYAFIYNLLASGGLIKNNLKDKKAKYIRIRDIVAPVNNAG